MQHRTEGPIGGSETRRVGTMKMNDPATTKRVAYLMGALALGSIVIGVGGWLLQAGDVPRTVVHEDAAPETGTSATEMARQYAINEVNADAQFKGRLLRVRGTVKSIATTSRNTPYVILDGGDAADTQALFAPDQERSLAGLRPGGPEISVRCQGGGKVVYIFLTNCTIR